MAYLVAYTGNRNAHVCSSDMVPATTSDKRWGRFGLVRRAVTALLIEPRRIADNGHIRFDIVRLFAQEDSKRRYVDFSVSPVTPDIMINFTVADGSHLLVSSGRDGHQIQLPVDQLGALSFRERVNVFQGVFNFLLKRSLQVPVCDGIFLTKVRFAVRRLRVV